MGGGGGGSECIGHTSLKATHPTPGFDFLPKVIAHGRREDLEQPADGIIINIIIPECTPWFQPQLHVLYVKNHKMTNDYLSLVMAIALTNALATRSVSNLTEP